MTRSCCLAVLLSLLLCTFSDAATIHVPSEQPTIQAGIDAAVNGDTVLVALGTYSGAGNRNIATNGNEVMVLGAYGPDSTIIDVGGEPYHGFYLNNSYETTNTVICGFAIANAETGIMLDHAAATVRNCRILDCSGYAIYCWFSTLPIVEDCELIGNSGGVYLESVYLYCGTGSCRRTAFQDNSGCGILSTIAYAEDFLVDSCHFTGNNWALWGSFTLTNSTIEGGEHGIGGDIVVSGADFKAINCLFRGLTGTVIKAARSSSLTECTLRANIGQLVYTMGDQDDYVTLEFTDCVIDSNSGNADIFAWAHLDMEGCTYSHNSGSIVLGETSELPLTKNLTNCNFQYNTAPVTVSSITNDNSNTISHCRFIENAAVDVSTSGVGHTTISKCSFVHSGGEESVVLRSEVSVAARKTGVNSVEGCTFVGCSGNAISIRTLAGTVNIDSCLIAFNDSVGLMVEDSLVCTLGTNLTVSCNDLFANSAGNYVGAEDQTGQNGNLAMDPLFCDTSTGDFHLLDESPCVPGNNECGTLIGALPAGCDFLCGDVDASGIVEISDAVYLINYIFVPESPAPIPYESGDADCSGVVEISDAVYIINYVFVPGSPAPCDPDGDGEPDC